MSTYKQNTTETNQRKFEEITAPQCLYFLYSVDDLLDAKTGHFHGSIFISLHARNFLHGPSDFPSEFDHSESTFLQRPCRTRTISTTWTT